MPQLNGTDGDSVDEQNFSWYWKLIALILYVHWFYMDCNIQTSNLVHDHLAVTLQQYVLVYSPANTVTTVGNNLGACKRLELKDCQLNWLILECQTCSTWYEEHDSRYHINFTTMHARLFHQHYLLEGSQPAHRIEPPQELPLVPCILHQASPDMVPSSKMHRQNTHKPHLHQAISLSPTLMP